MMKYAESGSLIMVILLAIAISIVALVIGQAIKFQQFKKL
jgi:putative Mn2+ efflux pump MntP